MKHLALSSSKLLIALFTACLAACGGGGGGATTYTSQTACMDGSTQTSAVSQADANSKVPANCAALTVAQLGAITFAADANNIAVLSGLPTNAQLRVPSSFVVSGGTPSADYTLTITSANPLTISASPGLIAGTTFTAAAGAVLQFTNAPNASIAGKSFATAPSGGGGTTYTAATACYDGSSLSSTVSQAAANALVPNGCQAFTTNQIAAIGFTGSGTSASIGSSLPSGALLAPNSTFVMATSGTNYTFTVSASTPATISVSPTLPAGTTFTAAAGAVLQFTNAPSISIVGKTLMTSAVVVPIYTIGGTVSNLATGNSLKLKNNGTEEITVLSSNSSFTFLTPVSTYAVTISAQPTGTGGSQSCSVTANATGTATANVSNVAITCTTSILNQAPVASFTVGTVYKNEAATFNASASTDPDGNIVSYAWLFGHNGASANGVTASYTYPAMGEYIAALGVEDNGGATAGSTRKINVLNTVVNPLSPNAFAEVANPAGGNFARSECIKDANTGLMWEGKTATGSRAGSNKFTNYDANFGTAIQISAANNAQTYINLVNSLALCGYTDWRLPTVNELLSIVDYNLSDPAFSSTWFVNTPAVVNSYYYWTQVNSATTSANAWTVELQAGYSTDVTPRADNTLTSVRLVR